MKGVDELECRGYQRQGFVHIGRVGKTEREDNMFLALFGRLRGVGTDSGLVGYLEEEKK